MAMPPTARTAADAAAVVGPDILAAALAASPDGVALLDEQGLCLHVNATGCALLGTPLAGLLGRPAPFVEPDARSTGPTRPRRLLRWTIPGSPRERELEHQSSAVHTADGRRLTAVTFRDVTDVRVQRRRFTAFASAAANVAYAGSLRGTLDAICAQLVETAGLAAAQIFLVDASAPGCGSTVLHPSIDGRRTSPCASRRPGTAGRNSARSRRCGRAAPS